MKKKKEENLTIIDADSLVYLVGYDLAGVEIAMLGIKQLDDRIEDILKLNKSPYYIGFFGKTGSKNFRYDIAKTKPYKGTRADKEDWYLFWEPILKSHMKNVWKFQDVDKVEADDAVIIAYHKYKNTFKTTYIASPDKDLKQCPGNHFNYKTRDRVIVEQSTADYLFALQLLLGDASDSIPGLPGCGEKTARKTLDVLAKLPGNLLDNVKNYYYTWFKDVIALKTLKKLEKEYLIQYKLDNDIKVLRSAKKSEALEDFKPDMSFVKTDKYIQDFYTEMYTLLRMLETEAEGLVHGFTLEEPTRYESIDWDMITNHVEALENLPTENDFKGFTKYSDLEGI
ncbi:MAG: hypothetical protein KAH32_06745 [Chlamydiia bacterium]|nr:hypothetical protein [Chlamydiia bacterium]